MNPQQYPPYGPPGPPGRTPPNGGWPANPGGFQQPLNGGGYAPPPPPPAYGPTPYIPPQPNYGPPVGTPGYPMAQHTPGYNPNPFPGETEQKSSNRKIIIYAATAVMVLLIVIVIVKVISDGKQIDPNIKPGTTTNTPGIPNVSTPNDDKLDLSQRLDSQSSLKEQSLQASIKQQVNLSSGFSFMVNDIATYTPTDPTIKPADGKRFIKVDVVAGNRAKSDNIDVSYLDFKLRNGRNELLTGDGATLKLLNNYLASPSSLQPGSQVSGSIIFQVDSDATEWALVHSESYRKITDGTSFTVQGSIALVSAAPAK